MRSRRQAEVDGIFDLCGRCAAFESEIGQKPDAVWDDEIDTGPEPRMRLTAMVNQLVAATGATHRDVNARINQTIGVRTRVGADEQVIRRAARAARDWLEQLFPSPQPDATAAPDVPDPGGRTVPRSTPSPLRRPKALRSRAAWYYGQRPWTPQHHSRPTTPWASTPS
ncbi:hypothetical protein [Streptomyces malaysiensis]|uniref:Uncharacterized protein n=1 Tax=Streptomyces malaysiensis subsp. samsunensis TaxID=459658 RepID=A0A9X2M3Y2_STRMQ|nr:hypothetical protein [Streptomyces samsunensis]MCQ8834842.1 hypothetical protein [Streptomyces samsunensis]